MKRPFLFILFNLIICLLLFKFFNHYVVLLYVIFSISLFLYLQQYLLIVLIGLVTLYSFYLSTATLTVEPINADAYSGQVEEYNLSAGDQFVLAVNQIKINDKFYHKKFKVLVTYHGSYNHLIGDKIQLKASVFRPPPNANPKMFNYQKYLLSQGIAYTAYANKNNVTVIRDNSFHWKKIMYDMRQQLLQLIDQIYQSKYAKFVKAFFIGFQGDQSFDDFYFAGIGHILVVSGMHFAIVYLFLQKVLSLLTIHKKIKQVILLSLLFVFLALIGFKISGMRTFSIIIIKELANHFNRRIDLLNIIALVALIFIIFNPLIIYSLSFILSFGAVISIGLFYQVVNEYLPSTISLIVSVQVIITLINVYFFNYKNFISLVINIPISFVVGFLYILIIINFVAFPLQVFTIIIETIIELIYFIVAAANQIKFLMINNVVLSQAFILIMCIILSYYIYNFENKKFHQKTNPFQLLSLILVIILIINTSVLWRNTLKVYFFDVGQGDCILVQTPQGANILIDGGPNTSYERLPEVLLKNNIKTIDYMVLTHQDSDHLNGLIEVTNALTVKNFIYSQHAQEILGDFDQLNLIKVHKNDKIKINEVQLNILNPIESYSYQELNNSSIVIALQYNDFDCLLTGDINQDVEKQLKALEGPIDLLKVSHHGSKFSTSNHYLKKIKPVLAVIQCGKNNYGHPHPEVIDRLTTHQVKILRTDRDGAVIVTVNNNSITIEKTKTAGGVVNVL